MKHIRSIVALALVVLAVYIITSSNMWWYTPYVLAAGVLSAWLSTKTRYGIWLVPVLFLMAIAWRFKVVTGASCFVAFGTLPGVLGLQYLAEVIRPMIPRQTEPAAVTGRSFGYPPVVPVAPVVPVPVVAPASSFAGSDPAHPFGGGHNPGTPAPLAQ